jgi:hypothetical protein
LGARPLTVASAEARVELVTKTGRVLRVFGEVDMRTLAHMIEAAEAC